MRRIIKKIIVLFLYYSGVSKVLGKLYSDRIFCIGYHSIWSQVNQRELHKDLYWNISIKDSDFEKQLLFLKKNGHTFINFSDLDSIETKKITKPTIIFFDDGFRDVCLNALPILKKHNIPAMVFITVNLAEQIEALWTIRVRHMLLSNKVQSHEAENIIADLKRLTADERKEKIHLIQKEHPISIRPADLGIFMGWNEINNLSQNGFEIGSHGVQHEKMTELGSALGSDLSLSKQILQEKTGKNIAAISYPYGRYNKDVEYATKSAGFSFGMTTESGLNTIASVRNHPFQMKRIEPKPEEWISSFAVKLYTNI